MKETKIKVYPSHNQQNVYVVFSGVGKYGKRIERFAELNKQKMKKERVKAYVRL